LTLAKAEKIFKDVSDDEEAVLLRGELTAKERESLDIEQKINNFTHLTSATTEERITKEIELVKASQSIYDMHAKTVKLANLENQLIDSKLQKRDEEISKLASLSMQYEKANMFEKDRIRRAAELAMMSASEVANAYEGSSFDKRVIEEYWGSFSKEAQRAIEETTTLFKDLKYKIQTPAISGIDNALLNKSELPVPIAPAIAQQINYSGSMIFYSINPDVIDKLAKLTPEEVIEYITTHPEAKQLIANIAANTNTK
jgi:hypothetical protein